MKKNIFILIQTILNFIALNVVTNPLMGRILPISAFGAVLGIVYWLILLILSYALAVRFENE